METAVRDKEEKYWIKPQMLVKHDVYGTVEVSWIETVRKRKRDGTRKTLLLGIHCTWTNEHGKVLKRKFHSRELKKID